MDLTQSIAPRSDQLNADDLMSGPRTVTITEVTAGNAEQPVNVHLAEFPDRPFKPSKSMRRVMVAAWGSDASAYAGRRLTLYRDPEITFGRDKVGGIRISHMSHIDKRLTIALTVTRGKRAPYHVEPLKEQAPTPRPMQEQTARMFAALAAIGKTDKASSLAYVSDVIGRPVGKSADLTPEDVAAVTAAAEAEQAAGGAA